MERILRVAAIQMPSENGQVRVNLRRAQALVQQAVGQGAALVLLPEFMPTGYLFSEAIWDGAEPTAGPTARWLGEQATRHGIYIGTSFLEAEGEDFFNTFVLTAPDGTEAGRVRKQSPAAFEAFYTRGEAGPHTIETDIGRIGVGICIENQLSFTPSLMEAGNIDLMLMPHSAPLPTPSLISSPRLIERYRDLLELTPLTYARWLGAPVVYANKTGPWETTLPFLPMLTQRASFPGGSTIVERDGTVRGRLDHHQGLVTAEVTIDSRRSRRGPAPSCQGHWVLQETPRRAHLLRVVEAAGAVWYRRSVERRRRARLVSGG